MDFTPQNSTHDLLRIPQYKAGVHPDGLLSAFGGHAYQNAGWSNLMIVIDCDGLMRKFGLDGGEVDD